MIRIVHLITGLDVGGAEHSLARLALQMDRSRFSNQVVSMIPPGPVGDMLRNGGVPVTSLDMRRGRPSLQGLLRLVALLRRERPDVLQTWLYHADLLGLVAARLARVPRLVWNVRCSDIPPAEGRLGLDVLVRSLALLSPRPDAVIANSLAGREFHTRFGYRPRRWLLIPNGVDSARFRPRPQDRAALRQALGLDETAEAIGLIARLHPMKDHHTFLAAASALARRRSRAVFVLAGEGCESGAAAFAARVTARGLADRIRLLGARHDLEGVLPALDLVTLISANFAQPQNRARVRSY